MGGADDGVLELDFAEVEDPLHLLDLASDGVDLLDAGADLHQFESLDEGVDAGLLGVEAGLTVVERLAGEDSLVDEVAGALQGNFGVDEVGAGGGEVGVGLGDFLGAGAVEHLGEAGFERGELALGLLDLGPVFVVLQADDLLALTHLVALFDADPGDAAEDLGGEFDLMGGDDVAGGVEDDGSGGGSVSQLRGADADGFDFRGGVLARVEEEASGGEQEDEDDGDGDPASGAALG